MENPHFKLAVPKKKKRCYQEKESPFPVPIASVTGIPSSNEKWCYYTGKVIDNHVEVEYSGDIDFLHKMGFFGKGNLSRHDLSHSTVRKIYSRRWQKGEGRQLKVTSRRKYLRRLAWKHSVEGEPSDSAELPTEILPIREPTSHGTYTAEPSNETAVINPKYSNIEDPRAYGINTENVSFDNETDQSNVLWGQGKDSWDSPIPESRDPWGEPAPGEVDPWSMNTEEESAAFWGSAGDTGTNSITEPSGTEHDPCIFEQSDSLVNEQKRDIDSDECDFTVTKKFKTSQKLESNRTETDQSSGDNKHSVTHDSEQTNILLEPSEALEIVNIAEFSKHCEDKILKTENKCDNGQEPLNVHVPRDHSETCEYADLVRTDDVKDENEAAVDPRCLSDHEDGSLFVVNDTDESDDEWSGNQPRLKWEPAVKRNPYNLKETLHLTFEEAFFLSYGLGCLVLLGKDHKPMNLSEMWKTFSERQPQFVQNYIVYHNFRSKGWVPKPGIKFGGDFVIYKDGPPFYHSTYVVLVRMVDESSLQEINCDLHRNLTWTSLAGQNRITEQASKELMICYVIKPTNLSEEDFMSPKCIPRFKIQEVVVKRWLLKHERENMQYMEIP